MRVITLNKNESFLEILNYPGDPVHSDDCESEDGDEGDAADQPDVVGAVLGGADDAVEVGAVLQQHVEHGVAEANHVHWDLKQNWFKINNTF